MNRVLKRPMFRMGGSTGTGITSGLDVPRKGYKKDGLVQKQKEVTDAALKFMVDSARARGQFTDDTPSNNNNNMQSTADSAVGGGSSLEDAIAIARAKAREMTPSDEMTTGQFSSRFLKPFGS